jgi:hypothetical protein
VSQTEKRFDIQILWKYIPQEVAGVKSIDIVEWGARNENANFGDGDFGGGDGLRERLCNGKMLW